MKRGEKIGHTWLWWPTFKEHEHLHPHCCRSSTHFVFRRQQCCIFPTLLTWMFQLTSTAGSKLSKSHAFKVFEYLSKTRWKEGEDFSQAIRWWDDIGNVDTAACSNPPVDACIFPLDHQALQDFSYICQVSTNPEKQDLTACSKKKCGCQNFSQVSKNTSRLPCNKLDFKTSMVKPNLHCKVMLRLQKSLGNHHLGFK